MSLFEVLFFVCSPASVDCPSWFCAHSFDVLLSTRFFCTARLYEAEACYEDFLEHAEHNLEMAYLARFLQEKCLSSKNLASLSFLLQAKDEVILQESCKMRYILQESCKMRYILQESCMKPARKMHFLARSCKTSCKILARFVFFSIRVLYHRKTFMTM